MSGFFKQRAVIRSIVPPENKENIWLRVVKGNYELWCWSYTQGTWVKMYGKIIALLIKWIKDLAAWIKTLKGLAITGFKFNDNRDTLILERSQGVLGNLELPLENVTIKSNLWVGNNKYVTLNDSGNITLTGDGNITLAGNANNITIPMQGGAVSLYRGDKLIINDNDGTGELNVSDILFLESLRGLHLEVE